MKVQHFAQVKKRDGRVDEFHKDRITNAIFRGMKATGEGDLTRDPGHVSDFVMKELKKKYSFGYVPHIEEIQDVVESMLIVMDFPKTAKSYILYRNDRAQIRDKSKDVPEHIKELASNSKQYFRNPLSEFIYYRSYSRWIEEEGRRETWIDTVDRFMSFMKENIGRDLREEEYTELREAILKHEIMPSMRLMWSAGKAARATNVAAFNCSFIAPSRIEDFAEIMYILMCGTGVGFSVESQTTQQLPIIKHQSDKKLKAHIIEDSKYGWADALTLGLRTWFSGKDVEFDYSKVRSQGARLRTMGGRSSGPDPLRSLLDFSRKKILAKQGRRLSNLDVHDIICKIGEVVVMGGVRRSALISLSDLDDVEMQSAKEGQFYLREPQRSMANNSAVYMKRPDCTEFLDEWVSLAKNGTGERGLFNRGSLKGQLPERRWPVFEADWSTCGTNPCGEIILKSRQFCNLTEIVARSEDTPKSLMRKMRLATILGTYQSTLINFPYLSREWRDNCKEERLLGVSITGQWDCPAVHSRKTLRELRDHAVSVNQEYADRFGVNASTAITCVKPSGTVSQLVDAASGLHARHAPYYIRRVRIAATDPLFHMLKDQKFPYHPEVGQKDGSASTYVLEFPVKAPEGAKYKDDITALEQLEHWKMVKEEYTEHNPSVTISIGEDEWIAVAHWLYENWDMLGGLSFLPRSDHAYMLAPYEEITEDRYEELLNKLPDVDFSRIVAYEADDETQGSKELACVAGVCEVDDIVAK